MLKKLNDQPLIKGIVIGAGFIFGTHLILFLLVQLLIYGLSLLIGLGDDPPNLKIQFLPQFWVLGTTCWLLFNAIFLMTKKMRDSIQIAPFILGQIIIILLLFFLYQGWKLDWTQPSEWFHLTVDETMVN